MIHSDEVEKKYGYNRWDGDKYTCSYMFQGNDLFPTLKFLSEYTHTFIDLGCGVGNICLLAKEAGFARSIGIELHPEAIKDARTNRISVIKADISKPLPFKKYWLKWGTVVYSWIPEPSKWKEICIELAKLQAEYYLFPSSPPQNLGFTKVGQTLIYVLK